MHIYLLFCFKLKELCIASMLILQVSYPTYNVPESILCKMLGCYFVHILNEDLLGCFRLNIRLIRHELQITIACTFIHTPKTLPTFANHL